MTLRAAELRGISTANDEPEVEKLYHQSYVERGKKMYYNQQGDTELEHQAENNFIRP